MHVCMDVYVCMYVCMYVCIYVCMYVCIYVFMYVCVHVFLLRGNDDFASLKAAILWLHFLKFTSL